MKERNGKPPVWRNQPGRRAYALLVTIGIIGVLALLATAFARIAQIEREVSHSFVDRVRARMLAEAGLEAAMGRLRGLEATKAWSDLRDGWIYGEMLTPLESASGTRVYKPAPKPLEDSKLPSWGSATQVKPDNRGYTGSLGGAYEVDGDVYSVKVLDCASMINVNNFDRPAEFGQPAHPGNQNLPRMLNRLGSLLSAGNLGADIMAEIVKRRQGGRSGEFSSKLELLTAALANDMTRFNKVREFITCHAWIDKKTVSFTKSGGNNGRWDIKPRSPINVNTASKEVLVACLSDLQANYLFHNHPTALIEPRSVGPISQPKAEIAAEFLITERNNFSGVTFDNVVQAAPTYTYNDWMHFRFQVVDKIPGFSKAEADLVHANANPNTDIRKYNPDIIGLDPGPDTGRTEMTGIDKSDMAGPAGWTGSTEFCWSSMGQFEVESVGRVYRDGAVIAEEKISTVMKLYDAVRLTTQKDFETNRVYSHPAFGSLVSSFGCPATVTLPEYNMKLGGGYRWFTGGVDPATDAFCASYDGGLMLSGMVRQIAGYNVGKKSFLAGYAKRTIESDQPTYGRAGEPTYSSERTKVQNSIIAADHGLGAGEGTTWGVTHFDTVLPVNTYGSGNRGSDLHSYGLYMNSQTRNRCRSYYGDEFPVPEGTLEFFCKPEVDIGWWGRSKSDVLNYVGWQPGPIQWDGRMHMFDWGSVGTSGYTPLAAYNELRVFTTKGRIFAHWRIDDGNDYVLWQDAPWARNTWHHIEVSWVPGAAPVPPGSPAPPGGAAKANFMFFVDGNSSNPSSVELPKDIRRNGTNGNVAPATQYTIDDPWMIIGGRSYNWPDGTSMGCVDFLGNIDNVMVHKWRTHNASFVPKSRYLDSSIAEYIQNIPGLAGPQTVGIYLRRMKEIEDEATRLGQITLGTLSCTHMHAWHLHSDLHVEGKGHLSPSIIVDGQVRYAYDSCAGLPLGGLTVRAGQQVHYVAYFEKRNDLPAMQSAILNDVTVTYWDKPKYIYRVWDSAR